MSVRDQVLKLLLDYPDATYKTIGSIAGCSRQRVHQFAKDAGLTRRRRTHFRSDVTVDKVLELYHKDLLIQEIAPILGCCRGTVTKRLREAGIGPGECYSRSMRLNWRGGNTHYRDDITVDRVLNLYHNDELLIKEMAQTLGCNQATVSSRLREAGIGPGECFSRGSRIKWRREKAKPVFPLLSSPCGYDMDDRLVAP